MTEQNILNFPAQISLEFGLDYLSRVKLTNLALAEQQLAAFLDRLLEQPPESGVLLELLETLRAPLCFINEEMARRYHNKMVPFTPSPAAGARCAAPTPCAPAWSARHLRIQCSSS